MDGSLKILKASIIPCHTRNFAASTNRLNEPCRNQKSSTTTLKQIVMSAYLRGIFDGAKAQYHDPKDLSPIIED
jgi:hypothetical protein